MAPTMRQVTEDYKDKVNFVLVNGDKGESWPSIEAFGVDAIPHMALVSSDGEVETALIGPVPKRVLEADLDGTYCIVSPRLLSNVLKLRIWSFLKCPYSHTQSFSTLLALISNAKRQAGTQPQTIPYRMLDVFAGNPEGRKVHFDP